MEDVDLLAADTGQMSTNLHRQRNRKGSSRRSSILKLSKSPARNVLSDLDTNGGSDGEDSKKKRKSRRVSFAETRFVREFHSHDAGKEEAAPSIKDIDALLTGSIQDKIRSLQQEPEPNLVVSNNVNATMIGNMSMDLTLCQGNTTTSPAEIFEKPSIDSKRFLIGLTTSTQSESSNQTKYFGEDDPDEMDLTGVNHENTDSISASRRVSDRSTLNQTNLLSSSSRFYGWDTTETKIYEPDESLSEGGNKTRIFSNESTGKMDLTACVDYPKLNESARIGNNTMIFKSGDCDMELTRCIAEKPNPPSSFNVSQFAPEHMCSPVAKVTARSFLDRLAGVEKSSEEASTMKPSKLFNVSSKKPDLLLFSEGHEEKVDALSFLRKLGTGSVKEGTVSPNKRQSDQRNILCGAPVSQDTTGTFINTGNITTYQSADMDLTSVVNTTRNPTPVASLTKLYNDGDDTGAMELTVCSGIALHTTDNEYPCFRGNARVPQAHVEETGGGERTVNFKDLTIQGNMSMTECVSFASKEQITSESHSVCERTIHFNATSQNNEMELTEYIPQPFGITKTEKNLACESTEQPNRIHFLSNDNIPAHLDNSALTADMELTHPGQPSRNISAPVLAVTRNTSDLDAQDRNVIEKRINVSITMEKINASCSIGQVRSNKTLPISNESKVCNDRFSETCPIEYQPKTSGSVVNAQVSSKESFSSSCHLSMGIKRASTTLFDSDIPAKKANLLSETDSVEQDCQPDLTLATEELPGTSNDTRASFAEISSPTEMNSTKILPEIMVDNVPDLQDREKCKTLNLFERGDKDIDDVFTEVAPWTNEDLQSPDEERNSPGGIAPQIPLHESTEKMSMNYLKDVSAMPGTVQHADERALSRSLVSSKVLNLSRKDKNIFEETLDAPHLQTKINETNKSASMLDLSRASASLLAKTTVGSNISCREEMANHSLIPEGGPKTIDDFLALFSIYEPPAVRRSTMSAMSMKQPQTLSEKLQMVIPELEGQMYEWVCKQINSSVSRCKELNQELGESLVVNPPEVFVQAGNDPAITQYVRTLRRYAEKKSKKTFKEWRIKMVTKLREELEVEEINIKEGRSEIEEHLQSADETCASLQQLEQILDTLIVDIESKHIPSPMPIHDETPTSECKHAEELVGLQNNLESLSSEKHEFENRLHEKHSLHESLQVVVEEIMPQSDHSRDFYWAQAVAIESLSKSKLEQWSSGGALFSFLYGTVCLDIKFEDCQQQKLDNQGSDSLQSVQSYSFSSKLSDQSTAAAKLCEQFIISTQFSNCHNSLPMIVREVCLNACRAEDLFADLEFCQLYHRTTFDKNRVTFMVSNLVAHCKFAARFTIDHRTYPTVRPDTDVTIHIGNISRDAILNAIQKIAPGYQYLRRVSVALNVFMGKD